MFVASEDETKPSIVSDVTSKARTSSYQIVLSWRKPNESFRPIKAPTTVSAARVFRTWPEPLLGGARLRSNPDSSLSLRTHVASVGGRTIHRLRCHMSTPSKDLSHNSILRQTTTLVQPQSTRSKDNSYLKIRKRHTMFRIMRLAQEQIPQPKFPRLNLQLFNNRNDRLPSVFTLGKLVVSKSLRGNDFFL